MIQTFFDESSQELTKQGSKLSQQSRTEEDRLGKIVWYLYILEKKTDGLNKMVKKLCSPE